MDRRRFLSAAAAGAALAALPRWASARALVPPLALPSARQLAWQRDQRALFIHFGINTFTGREWGDGHESPRLFAPTALDPNQWTRAARDTGFRALILTAKHHDGFCLWPSRRPAGARDRALHPAGEGPAAQRPANRRRGHCRPAAGRGRAPRRGRYRALRRQPSWRNEKSGKFSLVFNAAIKNKHLDASADGRGGRSRRGRRGGGR